MTPPHHDAPVDPARRQAAHRIRCEWGPAGAAAIGPGADLAVVVDVLSFTTTVGVALDLGVEVLPHRWRDATAAAFAAEHDATLAVGRSQAGENGISLSPATLRRAAGRGQLPARLVLPSPNGAAIAHGLGATGMPVVAASLRNAGAVARWVHAQGPDVVVAVVSAGERWPDGSLRPAVEDLWGAGAVVAALLDLGAAGASPEAEVAAASARAADLRTHLPLTASGAELVAAGYIGDVEIAAETDTSELVPVLRGAAFSAA